MTTSSTAYRADVLEQTECPDRKSSAGLAYMQKFRLTADQPDCLLCLGAGASHHVGNCHKGMMTVMVPVNRCSNHRLELTENCGDWVRYQGSRAVRCLDRTLLCTRPRVELMRVTLSRECMENLACVNTVQGSINDGKTMGNVWHRCEEMFLTYSNKVQATIDANRGHRDLNDLRSLKVHATALHLWAMHTCQVDPYHFRYIGDADPLNVTPYLERDGFFMRSLIAWWGRHGNGMGQYGPNLPPDEVRRRQLRDYGWEQVRDGRRSVVDCPLPSRRGRPGCGPTEDAEGVQYFDMSYMDEHDDDASLLEAPPRAAEVLRRVGLMDAGVELSVVADPPLPVPEGVAVSLSPAGEVASEPSPVVEIDALSDDDLPPLEECEDLVIRSSALGPEGTRGDYDEGKFGRIIFGYESDSTKWKDLILDGTTELEVQAFADLHPKDQALVMAEQVKQGILKAEAVAPGVLEAALADGSIAPQAIQLLAADPAQPVYAAAACQANLLHAMHSRHLPAREPVKQKYLDIIDAVFPIVESFIKKEAKDILPQKAREMKMDFCKGLSKKWDELRKSKRFIEALLYSAPRYVHRSGKTGLPKNASIKKNEGLLKMKPRGILSGGDLGTVIHMADAGLLEHVLFAIPFFEKRSVKHATPGELAARMAERITNMVSGGKFFRLNTDFGAFDSSVRWEIRKRIENKLCTWAADALGSVIGQAAAKDRNAQKHTARGYGCKITSKNWCRMSGDRGTSVCNYITNWVITLCAMVATLIDECGWELERALEEVSKVLEEGADRLLDLMAEGDDGSQYLAEAFVKMVGQDRFVQVWIDSYAKFGFVLEPQTVRGRESTLEALVDVMGRNEFVSRLFVPYRIIAHARGPGQSTAAAQSVVIRCRVFNKPRKVLDSLALSFNVIRAKMTTEEGRRDNALIALQEKALSAMASSVDCPPLFGLCKRAYDFALVTKKKHLGSVEGLGFKAHELEETYGELDGEGYYNAIVRKREKLSYDKAGDREATKMFLSEIIGSSPREGLTASAVIQSVDATGVSSDESFLAAWAKMRCTI